METDGKNIQQNYWIQIRHREFCEIHYDRTRGKFQKLEDLH